MTTFLIVVVLGIFLLLAYAGHVAESADTTPMRLPAQAPAAALDQPDEIAVGDRYLVPILPASVMVQLPDVEAKGEQYLAERIALAEFVIGDQIPAAERQAALYANELPGFTNVLEFDGFQQDADGAWYYDRFASWMRFPLNR